MPVTLYASTVDCANAAQLAEIWAAVLDRPVDEDVTCDFAGIGFATALKGANRPSAQARSPGTTSQAASLSRDSLGAARRLRSLAVSARVRPEDRRCNSVLRERRQPRH
jgi:hypothetical protein